MSELYLPRIAARPKLARHVRIIQRTLREHGHNYISAETTDSADFSNWEIISPNPDAQCHGNPDLTLRDAMTQFCNELLANVYINLQNQEDDDWSLDIRIEPNALQIDESGDGGRYEVLNTDCLYEGGRA